MAASWQTIATVGTADGVLELRRRRDDWLMLIDGRVLMNSFSHGSEVALAALVLGRLDHRPAQRVLVSGLGMGFTLRAVLDRVPATARVDVVEINPVVVEWCRGPLAAATESALGDPRVRVDVRDVAEAITHAPAGAYDLIILDLYEGPNAATQTADDPFYGPAALARTHRALAPGGVVGFWSEDPDQAFAKRFASSRFDVTKHAIRSGQSRHVVYVGRRA
jgi:spermidine synthase